MKRGIIIMAKVPEPGKVKTRLEPFLMPEQCARLADCLLRDTIAKAQMTQNEVIIAFSPADRKDYFDDFEAVNLTAQTGNDLGERMFNAFRHGFQNDFESVVMIGTDSPTFPPEFIDKAFELLEKSDSVLAPTTDGGFYLIGLAKSERTVFENVEWSTTRTFEQTKNNLRKCGLTLSELPEWYDVDEPADLEKLQTDENLFRFAPRTAEWIRAVIG